MEDAFNHNLWLKATINMHKTNEIIIAGFGGQGILFAGKILAYGGMLAGQEVSWLPSYGPEMRGGTANCSIIISNEKVSSPFVVNPNILVAMNKPSLDKFEDSVVKGGIIISDSSLVDRSIKRTDITEIKIPATKIAYEINAPKLANMVILGKLIKETSVLSLIEVQNAIKSSVPPSKTDLLEINNEAILKGYHFAQ